MSQSTGESEIKYIILVYFVLLCVVCYWKHIGNKLFIINFNFGVLYRYLIKLEIQIPSFTPLQKNIV